MFKFTIRELLLLTVIVGLAVGWWVNHQRSIALAAERERLWRECAETTLDGLEKSIGVKAHFTTPDGEFVGVPPPANIRDTVWKGPPLPRQFLVSLRPESDTANLEPGDSLKSDDTRWQVQHVRVYP